MSIPERLLEKVKSSIQETEGDIVQFLQKFLRYKSINPEITEETEESQIEECQRWLYDSLQKWGCFDKVDLWEIEKGQPNVAAIIYGEGSGKALLFNGHSDVVPVTKKQEMTWTGPGPWSGKITEGKIWGRGASDMKGGIVAFFWAARLLREAGIKLRGNVILTATIAEESGHHELGIDSVFSRGYSAPLCILGEPTNMEVAPAVMGEFYFKLRVDGKSSHIATRHFCVHPSKMDEVPGVNAIDKITKLLLALQELEREWGIHQKYALMPPGAMTLNISRIKGGDNFSSLAHSCEVVGSVLFNPSLSSEQVISEFRDAINRVAKSDYWLRSHPPVLEIPYIVPIKEPVNVPLDDPACQILSQAFEEATGCKARFSCSTATSDGNFIFKKGQPVIEFGPGSNEMGVHGSNEYIPISQLIEACKVYAIMMTKWCGYSHKK